MRQSKYGAYNLRHLCAKYNVAHNTQKGQLAFGLPLGPFRVTSIV